jgi:hypothetical protein
VLQVRPVGAAFVRQRVSLSLCLSVCVYVCTSVCAWVRAINPKP